MIPFGKIIFSIPIYRNTKNDYYKSINEKRQKRIDPLTEKEVELGGNRDEARKFYERLYEFDEPHWEYNNIVGWIVIYAHGGILKADWWFVYFKRIPRVLKNRNYVYMGKLIDVCLTYNLSNEEIKNCIVDFFRKTEFGQLNNKLKNRYIDLSILSNTIKYMDIKKLVDDIIEAEKQSIETK